MDQNRLRRRREHDRPPHAGPAARTLAEARTRQGLAGEGGSSAAGPGWGLLCYRRGSQRHVGRGFCGAESPDAGVRGGGRAGAGGVGVGGGGGDQASQIPLSGLGTESLCLVSWESSPGVSQGLGAVT